MRILMVHNYYQQWGGEDESTEQELQLLQRHGHEVRLYFRHNDEIKTFSSLRKGLLFFEPTWSLRSYRETKHIVREFKPEIAHFQNFFPLVSPSAYYACAESGVPVVHTLRDYRLLCPIGWFVRNGEVCEACLAHSLWRGVLYGCYHGSRIQTASIALMLVAHRLLKTWLRKVDVYIALTEFSRRKFIEGGLPKSKIFVRPNFLDKDPGLGGPIREYALFVGRLSPEKGLVTLLEAWRDLPDVPLKIIGDGPLRSWIEEYIVQNELGQIELVGFVPLQRVLQYLQKALFLVMPSVWYETFGRTIIEAYATGTPVIASRLGAMVDLVEEGETGFLFNPGEPGDLAARVQYALEHPEKMARWGREARYVFEHKYSSDSAYKTLMEIYDKVTGK
jgi:glycosyltransferase involved in cell wall biosynthesis